MQRGPNNVGSGGVLQAFADGLKLILEEIFLPSQINLGSYFLSLFLPWGSPGQKLSCKLHGSPWRA